MPFKLILIIPALITVLAVATAITGCEIASKHTRHPSKHIDRICTWTAVLSTIILIAYGTAVTLLTL